MRIIERFTAQCVCPVCKLLDCHPIREPKPYGQGTPMRSWRKADGATTEYWGFDVWRTFDESSFEVIRVCRCGYQWGQG